MPNITAYLTIGKAQPNGGFIPTHWAYLAESAYPSWCIVSVGLLSDCQKVQSRWLTSPETVIDDALAMVAVVVEEIPGVTNVVGSVAQHILGETVDLSQLSDQFRKKLTWLNQTAKHSAHVIVTILSGSMVYSQMHEVVRYPVSIVVCTATYAQDGSFAKFKGFGVNLIAPQDPFFLN